MRATTGTATMSCRPDSTSWHWSGRTTPPYRRPPEPGNTEPTAPTGAAEPTWVVVIAVRNSEADSAFAALNVVQPTCTGMLSPGEASGTERCRPLAPQVVYSALGSAKAMRNAPRTASARAVFWTWIPLLTRTVLAYCSNGVTHEHAEDDEDDAEHHGHALIPRRGTSGGEFKPICVQSADHFSATVWMHEIAWFGDTVSVILVHGEPETGVVVNGIAAPLAVHAQLTGLVLRQVGEVHRRDVHRDAVHHRAGRSRTCRCGTAGSSSRWSGPSSSGR